MSFIGVHVEHLMVKTSKLIFVPQGLPMELLSHPLIHAQVLIHA